MNVILGPKSHQEFTISSSLPSQIIGASFVLYFRKNGHTEYRLSAFPLRAVGHRPCSSVYLGKKNSAWSPAWLRVLVERGCVVVSVVDKLWDPDQKLIKPIKRDATRSVLFWYAFMESY